MTGWLLTVSFSSFDVYLFSFYSAPRSRRKHRSGYTTIVGKTEFKEQRLQLFVTSVAMMTYSVHNNGHDYLDYGHASLKEYGR